MALSRPKFPKPKNVIVINDVPVKLEIENEEPYSSSSNLNLLTTLRTGKVFTWSKNTDQNFKGIKQTDIFPTYLDYDYFGGETVEKNFDFCKEIKKKKDIPEDEIYHAIPHQKDCYVSDRLWNELNGLLESIRTVKPKLIILTGKWALFFLTGAVSLSQTAGNVKDRKPLGGLVKYRSSVMSLHECWGEFEHNPIVVPVYHPLNATAMPDKVPILELDFQKIAYYYHRLLEENTDTFHIPERDLIIGDSLEKIQSYFDELFSKLDKDKVYISCDIETMFSTIIDCIGFSYEKDRALCVPLAAKEQPLIWSEEEEFTIMCLFKKLFEHPNAEFVLQNGSYDAQFVYFNWCLNLFVHQDTMVLHHIMYNYLPKSLDFLASLYCDNYIYWKNMQNFSGKDL